MSLPARRFSRISRCCCNPAISTSNPQEAATASVVAGHRGTILPGLAVDPDAGRAAAAQHSDGGVGDRHRVVRAQRRADRLRSSGDLLSAVHPGLGIAGRRRFGLRLEPDPSDRRRQQLARGHRIVADRGGRRRSRFQERVSGLVGRVARNRRRAPAIGARGVGLPASAGQPTLGLDRPDQLPALSVALAAIGIFRDHQIRAADIAGARAYHRTELWFWRR